LHTARLESELLDGPLELGNTKARNEKLLSPGSETGQGLQRVASVGSTALETSTARPYVPWQGAVVWAAKPANLDCARVVWFATSQS